MAKQTHRETLAVIATGKVAPYGINEAVRDIPATHAAIKAALTEGHIVKDSDGKRVDLDTSGDIVRW
jgi:hypothetical protein